jgi:hypothetical protein
MRIWQRWFRSNFNQKIPRKNGFWWHTLIEGKEPLRYRREHFETMSITELSAASRVTRRFFEKVAQNEAQSIHIFSK